jgi:mRNA (guanine-N7-)-methyltransferase
LAKVFEKFPSFNYSNTILLENHLEKFEVPPSLPLSFLLSLTATQRNIFGSGIICPDFDTSRVDEDELLHPEGDLARHLVAMATQQPINILRYIQAQSGSSSLFPTEYPTPPAEPLAELIISTPPSPSVATSETAPQQHVNEASQAAPPPAAAAPQVRVSDHELLWYYLLHTCNQNAKVAQQCLDQKSLPGPKATPFRRSSLDLIKQCPESYVVCEKTDGDRAVLVVSPEHGEIYFVYRNHTVERLYSAGTTLSNQTCTNRTKDWLTSLPGLTVFDGELVSGCPKSSSNSSNDKSSSDGGGGGGVAAYLCFDAIFLNGQFIGTQPNCSLLHRMSCVGEWLTQSAEFLQDIFLKQHPTIRSSLPLLFRCKEMLLVKDIKEVTSRMTPARSLEGVSGGARSGNEDSAYWGWIYESPSPPPDSHSTTLSASCSFPHLCDGLVFTPIQANYYEYLAIKWKPCHMCTNDYWISLNDLRQVSNQRGESGDGSLVITGYLPLSNKQTNSKIPICQINITTQQIREILSPSHHQQQSRPFSGSASPSHVIAECSYDKQLSLWRVHKIRDDKATSNTLQAAWSNLEVISEGLELSSLISSFENLKTPLTMSAAESKVRSSPMEVIDKHYDQIQQLRHQQKGGGNSLESRIAMHRKVMNWSKACLLQHTLMLPSASSSSSIDEYSSLITQALASLQANTRFPSSASAKPPNFLKAGPPKKRGGGGAGGGKKQQQQQINVLDLACGRGGDIKKFTSECKVGCYLGIDISAEQIKECIERTRENRSILSSVFHHGDAGDGLWHRQVTASEAGAGSGRGDGIGEGGIYDIAWCMFAFHYFCDTEIRCRNFFESVSYLLKTNGKFVLTFPNPFAIHHDLSSAYAAASSEAGTGTGTGDEKDPICSVRFHSSAGQQEPSLEDCLTQFGIIYDFTLGDAVQNCPEFVVPLKKVLELAQEYHFSLVPHSASASGASSGAGLVTMNQWLEEECLANENYLNLRSAMQVCGPRAPGRNVSLEEWNAISLYACLTFQKLP